MLSISARKIHGFIVAAMSEDYQMIMRYANSAFEQLLNAVNVMCLQFYSGSWQEAHTDLLPLQLSQGAPTDIKSASSQVYVVGVAQPTSIFLYLE